MYDVDTITGCWLWRGRLRDGYGRIDAPGVGSKTLSAHRVFWEREHGTIPPKVQLDHMCRRRNCVRPCHMDPVTNRENNRRVFAWHRRLIERCPANHLLAEHGIDTPEGGRVCRLCSFGESP